METKQTIYDELCEILTEYENQMHSNDVICEDDLYRMLVKIQNNWETVITATR